MSHNSTAVKVAPIGAQPSGPFARLDRDGLVRRHAALFRVFAETEPTPEGIKTFSDRYASPWAVVEYVETGPAGPLIFTGSQRDAKLPKDWREQLLDFQRCIDLYDLVRAGDWDTLAQHIQWLPDAAGNPSVCYDSHPKLKPGKRPPPPDVRTTEVIASTKMDRTVFGRLTRGDVYAPARIYVSSVINKQLRGLVESRLDWNSVGSDRSLQQVPQTVLGGLWLQLASAIAESKEYARCRECAAWFEARLPGSRSTRVYCSDVCKVKAHLNRQVRAFEMTAQGKTVKQIAAELGTNKDAVRGWLAKAKVPEG